MRDVLDTLAFLVPGTLFMLILLQLRRAVRPTRVVMPDRWLPQSESEELISESLSDVRRRELDHVQRVRLNVARRR